MVEIHHSGREPLILRVYVWGIDFSCSFFYYPLLCMGFWVFLGRGGGGGCLFTFALVLFWIAEWGYISILLCRNYCYQCLGK